MIDSHCHLYLKGLIEDLPAVLERATNQGVTEIICPGIDLETSRQSVELSNQYPAVYAAVGIHPNYAGKLPGDYLKHLSDMTKQGNVTAIGEIGLDYYRDYCSPARQQKMFREQLELAMQLDLPVIIHNRDANEDIISILQESGINRGVAHCFSGDLKLAEQFLDLGFYISFAGNLTYKNSPLPEVARKIPLEHLLVETDAPFLSPVPFRGKPNEPGRVRFVAQKLAEIKEVDLALVSASTSENTKAIFKIT